MSNNTNIFEIYPAKSDFIGIVSIPHSGEFIPEHFKSFLVEENWDLMQDVDFRVHELIDINKLQNAGITVLKSNIIRTAIDLNRSRDLALLNWKNNSKGIKLVTTVPDEKTAEQLLGSFYDPYYEMLNTLVFELGTKYKTPSLVDLHSMPGFAEEYHLKINPTQNKERPDFCISDVNGQTCSPDFIQFIKNELDSSYAQVTINNPYFGGHVTRYLDQKHENLNNIQIEISRTLYMDEKTKELKDTKKLTSDLTSALIRLFQKYK